MILGNPQNVCRAGIVPLRINSSEKQIPSEQIPAMRTECEKEVEDKLQKLED